VHQLVVVVELQVDVAHQEEEGVVQELVLAEDVEVAVVVMAREDMEPIAMVALAVTAVLVVTVAVPVATAVTRTELVVMELAAMALEVAMVVAMLVLMVMVQQLVVTEAAPVLAGAKRQHLDTAMVTVQVLVPVVLALGMVHRMAVVR